MLRVKTVAATYMGRYAKKDGYFCRGKKEHMVLIAS